MRMGVSVYQESTGMLFLLINGPKYILQKSELQVGSHLKRNSQTLFPFRLLSHKRGEGAGGEIPFRNSLLMFVSETWRVSHQITVLKAPFTKNSSLYHEKIAESGQKKHTLLEVIGWRWELSLYRTFLRMTNL